MIKNIFRKLLPPSRKTQEKDTRFEKALQVLSSKQKSILLSYFLQWLLEDTTVFDAIKRSPLEVQKAWIHITEGSNGKMVKEEIVDDFRRYILQSTNKSIVVLSLLQRRLRSNIK